MTIVYLIRHSTKEKNYGEFDSTDSSQVRNEKFILSVDGEERAKQLAMLDELSNINELWSSNYVRAMQTAKYIAQNNNIKINISDAFDERHYGTFNTDCDREEFWIGQFKDRNLKNVDGESQLDVQNRIDIKLNEILKNNKDKKVAIVCHNACILFYILKYCKLDKAEVKKKLTISYNGNILINDEIIEAPSIMKLEFDNDNLVNISYLKLD